MKYFKDREFKCKCKKCNLGYKDMDTKLLDMLDKARDIAGVAFIVNSAIRCTQHNTNVGGSPRSSHLKGKAVDLKVIDNRSRFKIVSALLEVGFRRILIYNTFIHIDVAYEKLQDILVIMK